MRIHAPIRGQIGCSCLTPAALRIHAHVYTYIYIYLYICSQEIIADLKAVAPHTLPEYQLAIVHAKLVIALDELHAAHVDCVEGLEVIAKPAARRGVRATRDFAAGALTLVPLTNNIALKKVGKKIASKQAVVVEHDADVDNERYNAWLCLG